MTNPTIANCVHCHMHTELNDDGFCNGCSITPVGGITRTIITNHIRPPIPTRDYDWCAYYEGTEEDGNYGYGETEDKAIESLQDLWEEPSKNEPPNPIYIKFSGNDIRTNTLWQHDQVALTGNTRYRTNWRGKLILQVEETIQSYDWRGGGSYSPEFLRWRDAAVEDLTSFDPKGHQALLHEVA